MRSYRHCQGWPAARHTVPRARRLALRLLAVASVLAAAGGVAVSAAGPAAAAPQLLNVKDFGATGNGSSNDTAAINKAITAANAAGPDGGIVRFPAGTYKSSNTIHMKSNVTLQLDAGSTIMGASGTGYDAPESNPNDSFQDFGHSHFHDAMIWGDRLTNIGFVGAGTIDGGGHLITGNPDSGQADKIISLTRCKGLELSGITLRRGGHFAALINGCDTVHSDHLTINTSSDRDAWNIISSTNVTITNGDINGNDDAIVFKSDFALGAKLPNGHVKVLNTHASAGCCNALMFGSETCGDFTDYVFDHITITGANKSGLGMVSMDGANISDVHYSNITETNVASPIMAKIGTRKRCGNSPGVGHISNITYENITATGKSSPQYSPTLWGQPGGNRISNLTFTNVDITVPGGHAAMSTGVPSDNGDYNPNSIGTRPAYGWYIHNADDIHFVNSSTHFQSGDARPAVIANSASGIRFDGLTAQRGSGSPHDVGFQSVTGFCVANSQNTSGDALRVSNSGSTQDCGATNLTRYEAESAAIAQGVVESNHAGFSGTGFVNGDNAAGSGVTWTVTMAQAGPATVSIRFANGQAGGAMTDRPMDLTVNGTAAGSITFPPTGDWAVWQTAAVTLPLVAGANTVQLTASTATGGPNLDFLEA